MSGGETKDPAKSTSTATLGAVALLIAALAVWGYLRGMFGQASSAIHGVQQLAPQAEDRNRLVRELADQPKSAEPK